MKAWRRHLGFILASAVILLLLAVAVVLALRFRAEFVRVDRELHAQRSRLQSLQRRNPYPSEENVALLAEQREQIQDSYALLTERLGRGQFAPLDAEPARVPSLVYQTVEELKDLAAEAQIDLPAGMAFGFDRYLAGQPPRAEDVPRLSQQLQEIEHMVRLLVDARVAAIERVERTVFEDVVAPGARDRYDVEDFEEDEFERAPISRRRMDRRQVEDPLPVRRPETLPGENELFVRERYRLLLRGNESAIWDALNRLAASDLVVRVNELQLSNLAADAMVRSPGVPRTGVSRMPGYDVEEPDDWDVAVRPGVRRPSVRPPGREPAQLARPLTRDERLLSGREKVSAIIGVEVYRFKASPSVKEQRS